MLPGIAPITTIAMLLPFTFGLSPASAMIMLAGIFYGAQYGGSTTAILVNVPGETSSAIVTCLDGHQMAKQGQAGTALAIAAIASFFAGTVATVVIATASVPLAWLALKFTAVGIFQPDGARANRRGRARARLARQVAWRWCCSACCSASSASTSIPARRA